MIISLILASATPIDIHGNHQYFNTARNFCSFLNPIFARELRLVDRDALLPPAKVLADGIGAQYRSVQGMIYFLGEMIARRTTWRTFVPAVYHRRNKRGGRHRPHHVPLFRRSCNDPER